MKRKLVSSLLLSLFVFGIIGVANATTITFKEQDIPNGQLEGTTYYDSYGLSFESSSKFGFDPRLIDDGHGITNLPESTGVIHFAESVSNVYVSWAVAMSFQEMFIELYDENSVLIDSFSSGGGIRNGEYTYFGDGIRSLKFHDDGGWVAIDTLSFDPVPEPATILLLSLGFTGLAGVGRKKFVK